MSKVGGVEKNILKKEAGGGGGGGGPFRGVVYRVEAQTFCTLWLKI